METGLSGAQKGPGFDCQVLRRVKWMGHASLVIHARNWNASHLALLGANERLRGACLRVTETCLVQWSNQGQR